MQRTRQRTAARSLSFYFPFRTHPCLRNLKLVSNAPYGLNVFLIRIFSQFSSQTGDHTPHRIINIPDFFFPGLRIDLFFREHSPWMSRQETKDIKLIFRKSQVLLSYPYVSALNTDMQLSAANLRICIFRLPLQHKNLQLFPLFGCKYILEDLANLYPRRIFLYAFPILPILSLSQRF